MSGDSDVAVVDGGFEGVARDRTPNQPGMAGTDVVRDRGPAEWLASLRRVNHPPSIGFVLREAAARRVLR